MLQKLASQGPHTGLRAKHEFEQVPELLATRELLEFQADVAAHVLLDHGDLCLSSEELVPANHLVDHCTR